MYKIEKNPSMKFIFLLEIMKRPLLHWFSGGALNVPLEHNFGTTRRRGVTQVNTDCVPSGVGVCVSKQFGENTVYVQLLCFWTLSIVLFFFIKTTIRRLNSVSVSIGRNR
jgi:hypothetical protein